MWRAQYQNVNVVGGRPRQRIRFENVAPIIIDEAANIPEGAVLPGGEARPEPVDQPHVPENLWLTVGHMLQFNNWTRIYDPLRRWRLEMDDVGEVYTAIHRSGWRQVLTANVIRNMYEGPEGIRARQFVAILDQALQMNQEANQEVPF